MTGTPKRRSRDHGRKERKVVDRSPTFPRFRAAAFSGDSRFRSLGKVLKPLKKRLIMLISLTPLRSAATLILIPVGRTASSLFAYELEKSFLLSYIRTKSLQAIFVYGIYTGVKIAISVMSVKDLIILS